MARVCGYIRYGGEDSASYSGQQTNIESYCQTYDHHLVRIYSDKEPSSDRDLDSDNAMVREGLQEMLADLSHREIEQVVVINTSRLWRTDVTKVLLYRELQRYQVDISAIAQPTFSIYKHGRDSSWYWTEGMLDLLVQYEQLAAALRLRRGRTRKVHSKGFSGRRPPFGYKVDKDSNALVVDPRKAAIVRRVFELAEKQPGGSNPSPQQIADQLNAEGLTPMDDTPLQKADVKKIIDRRDFYLGKTTQGDHGVSKPHEPLLQMSFVFDSD